MDQSCLVDTVDLIALRRRGARYAYVKGDGIYFILERGSVMDDIEKLQDLKEYMQQRYSYKLYTGYAN